MPAGPSPCIGPVLTKIRNPTFNPPILSRKFAILRNISLIACSSFYPPFFLRVWNNSFNFQQLILKTKDSDPTLLLSNVPGSGSVFAQARLDHGAQTYIGMIACERNRLNSVYIQGGHWNINTITTQSFFCIFLIHLQPDFGLFGILEHSVIPIRPWTRITFSDLFFTKIN